MSVDPRPPLSPRLNQAPPSPLVQRVGHVTTGITNTIRVPHDRFKADRTGDWFTMDKPAVGPGMQPIRAGNDALFLVQGMVALPEMAAAIRTATRPGHFIFMLNWFCDLDFTFPLSNLPGEMSRDTHLRELLRDADDKGVTTRAMFWRQPASSQNRDAWLFLANLVEILTINGPAMRPRTDHEKDAIPPMRHSAAIWDLLLDLPIPIPIIGLLPRALGSHHHKLLAVQGEQGLVCFCGGVDWNPDRIRGDGAAAPPANPPPSAPPSPPIVVHGNPLHDVHCRVIGPAARDLVQVFYDRWHGHPDAAAIDARHGALPDTATPAGDGPHTIQIGRTFGHGGFSYKHAPDGELTLAQLMANAIGKARRFLYTECQYFVGAPRLQEALAKALPNIEHFTVVLTHWEISDLPQVNKHRREFINFLKGSKGGDKVRIFALQPEGNTIDFQKGRNFRTYVHAKIWVVDDEFALIGSPNSNRRGWSHDNEMVAGIYDPSNEKLLTHRFAHLFRTELWQQHLGLPKAELSDGVASAAHWLNLPPDARVRPYNPDERNADGDNDIGPVNLGPFPIPLWDAILDPA